MTTLTDLHQLYDGAIPRHARDVARLGSSLLVELIKAEGQARFFRSMILGPFGRGREGGQLNAIRLRKADGSYYPAMAADLTLYFREWRRWRRTAAGLQAQFNAQVVEIAAAEQIAA